MKHSTWLNRWAAVLAFALPGQLALAQPTAAAAPPAAAAQRDGQHDFDFEFGTWKAHLRRLLNPLTGSSTWVELDGTSVLRRVWGGRANLGEFDVRNASSHIQGLSLRTFNPETGQWSITWVNARDGQLTPPMVGGFQGGRGEFYNQDTLRGKAIFARFIFSDITPNSFKLEQAFSADGGKTWEANWIATFTKVGD